MNYSAYGLVISSTLPLPELPPAGHEAPLLAIARRSGIPSLRGWTWLQPRPTAGRPRELAIAKLGTRHWLIFADGAQFIVSADAGSIAACVGSRASVVAVRHRLIDQVLPLVMSHRGRVVLHASAVATPSGAVAFIGPGGAGKSTLAASFAASGAAIIADDALCLDPDAGQWLAVPAYPGLRVRHDVLGLFGAGVAGKSKRAPTAKRRLTSDDGVAFAPTRLPLRRVYILKRAAATVKTVRIDRLEPREIIMALLGHAFVLDIGDQRRLAEHFARVCAASAGLDVRRLTYPRKVAALSQVRAAVLADAAGEPK